MQTTNMLTGWLTDWLLRLTEWQLVTVKRCCFKNGDDNFKFEIRDVEESHS